MPEMYAAVSFSFLDYIDLLNLFVCPVKELRLLMVCADGGFL